MILARIYKIGMGYSTQAFSFGLGDLLAPGICPARSPGILGINDQADPNAWSLRGDAPGPICAYTRFSINSGFGFASQLSLAGKKTLSEEDTKLIAAQNDPDFVAIAAVAYGEASTGNVFEEIAAIANVIVRQKNERNTTIAKLLSKGGTFAFAATDGNQRTAAFRKATPPERLVNPGMLSALKGAENAISGAVDYSNGAYFWDGGDIKSNYSKHPKVKQGIKFTQSEHNIYNIDATSVDVTEYWRDAKNNLTTKIRGKYTYVYESTAAYGGTIFWKYGADFLKATGNKAYN